MLSSQCIWAAHEWSLGPVSWISKGTLHTSETLSRKSNGKTITIDSCCCQWLITHRVKDQHLILDVNLSTFNLPSLPPSLSRNYSSHLSGAQQPRTHLHMAPGQSCTNTGTVSVYKRALSGLLHLKILLTGANWSRMQLIPHNPLFATQLVQHRMLLACQHL